MFNALKTLYEGAMGTREKSDARDPLEALGKVEHALERIFLEVFV